MSRLRLILVLILGAALELATPAAPGAHDVMEEFEEAAHTLRARRVTRIARDPRTPPVRTTHHTRVQRAPRVGVEASRRTVSIVPARKIPPAVAESSSAPEDH